MIAFDLPIQLHLLIKNKANVFKIHIGFGLKFSIQLLNGLDAVANSMLHLTLAHYLLGLITALNEAMRFTTMH